MIHKCLKCHAILGAWESVLGVCQSGPCARNEYAKSDAVQVVKESDPVNHPAHYTRHPSGVECIQVTEHMGFNLGNAVKYIWRADEKGNAIQDLQKARWYLDREIARRQKGVA